MNPDTTAVTEEEEKQLSHIDRMAVEMRELQDKVVKLCDFLVSKNASNLDELQTERLKKQLRIMKDYESILFDRIEYDINKEIK